MAELKVFLNNEDCVHKTEYPVRAITQSQEAFVFSRALRLKILLLPLLNDILPQFMP